ncbi:hypothetical protein CPAR01_09006 [Colletotrichum paranaense]|uniref:Mind kinetochore complex component n=1 Tax=Colletotrichum paranaense TaxID=1914294 RepID=A0ABQ9SFH8_9PEZI|nr:uncharacterized protein CPAR01_09006 [Colletotrichum paranaense]KAK1535464.1 hypothetical protein CPAR01_09006 [Colletotrichum paranaense]
MSAPDQDQSQPTQSIKESSSQIQSQDHAVQHQPETESHPGAGASSTSTTPAPGATSPTTAQALQQPQEPSQQAQETLPQQPPASPPLPQKHTPATPGPRAGRFIQLYDGALASTLRKVNYDNFASCFPTVAAHAPNTLRNVQKQMVDYLEERCNKDFQSILADRDVIRKLNELENLVSDADRRRQEGGSDVEEPIPTNTSYNSPHVLPPDEILTAHLAPRLAPQQSTLNARLQNTQASNESLFASIHSQRAEIDALLAQLESQVADIDGANALLVDVAPELAAEARASEVEMAGM